MSPFPLFVDQETGTIDTARILAEGTPLAKLVGLLGAIALAPYAIAVTLFPYGGFGVLLTVLSQFLLVVSSAIVLMYVIARAIQLSAT